MPRIARLVGVDFPHLKKVLTSRERRTSLNSDLTPISLCPLKAASRRPERVEASHSQNNDFGDSDILYYNIFNYFNTFSWDIRG